MICIARWVVVLGIFTIYSSHVCSVMRWGRLALPKEICSLYWFHRITFYLHHHNYCHFPTYQIERPKMSLLLSYRVTPNLLMLLIQIFGVCKICVGRRYAPPTFGNSNLFNRMTLCNLALKVDDIALVLVAFMSFPKFIHWCDIWF